MRWQLLLSIIEKPKPAFVQLTGCTSRTRGSPTFVLLLSWYRHAFADYSQHGARSIRRTRRRRRVTRTVRLTSTVPYLRIFGNLVRLRVYQRLLETPLQAGYRKSKPAESITQHREQWEKPLSGGSTWLRDAAGWTTSCPAARPLAGPYQSSSCLMR